MLQIVIIPNSWREVRARYGIRKSCNFVGISSRLFCIAEQVYFPDNRERSYLPQGHLRSELLSPTQEAFLERVALSGVSSSSGFLPGRISRSVQSMRSIEDRVISMSALSCVSSTEYNIAVSAFRT